MDTIEMFDGYCHSPEELTNELRHQKRMALEPLIFGALTKKYGSFLQKFWNNHTVPVNNKRIVIVERRNHPNFTFVLHNSAYYGADWGITVICSDENMEYCKQIIGDKPTVAVIPMFKGIGTPEEGKKEYNELLQNETFYSLFGEEYLCIVEMDCYFRRKIPDWVFQFDLVGCPYFWNKEMAGGGLSFRNRKAMIEICRSFPEKMEAQDVYLWKGAQKLGMKLPSYEEASRQLTESVFSLNPFGVHQWWTFFFPNELEDCELYFEELTTLRTFVK